MNYWIIYHKLVVHNVILVTHKITCINLMHYSQQVWSYLTGSTLPWAAAVCVCQITNIKEAKSSDIQAELWYSSWLNAATQSGLMSVSFGVWSACFWSLHSVFTSCFICYLTAEENYISQDFLLHTRCFYTGGASMPTVTHFSHRASLWMTSHNADSVSKPCNSFRNSSPAASCWIYRYRVLCDHLWTNNRE